MVEFLPLQTNCFVNWAKKAQGHGDGGNVDDDVPESVRFGCSERCVDPLDTRLAQSKLQVPELHGFGEIE